MKLGTAYRLTVSGKDERRQYHFHSKSVADVYVQTYLKLGKQISFEKLVDGLWKPVSI